MSDLAVRQGVGRLFVDRLEQGRSPVPEVDDRRSTSRSFEESMEGVRRPGARTANRPRAGAIAAASAICLLAVGAIALWPMVSSGLKQSPAAARRGTNPFAATGAARPVAQVVPTAPADAAAPRSAAQPRGGATAAESSIPRPAVSPQVTSVPSARPGGAPTAQRSLAASNASSIPAVTFAHGEVEGLGADHYFATRGAWTRRAGGGYPGFKGLVLSTTSPTAWAEWSLGHPTSGERWDQVRVRVWIPNASGGAWVRYRVTATDGRATSVSTFDVPQQEHGGWYTLGTFSIGSATQRRGSIWVHMNYLRPYTGQAAGTCPNRSCTAMAAAVVELAWS